MKNRLSETDYNQVLACIEAIHRCRQLEDFPRHVLAELRKLVDCNNAGYNEVNLRRNRAVILMDPPMQSVEHLQQRFGSLMHEHPVINYFNETGDGQTLKISDFLSVREFHQLAIYREVYEPLHAEDQISFGVKVEPGFIIGIAFNRDGRTFTEKDRLRLNLVRPHIIQAYLLAAELAGHQEEQRDLLAALRESGLGVISLDKACNVVHSTPGAFERIASYIPVPDSSVPTLPKNLAQWASEPGESGHAPFVVGRGQGRLIIRRVHHEDRVLLLLSEENASDIAKRLSRFQLTPRESEVLRWVAEGKSNAEIGRILGLTMGTVKLHVERILTKLGVENRTSAALVARDSNF